MFWAVPALASYWLRHFRLLLWNCWTEFKETWLEAWSQWHLPRSKKQDGRPGLWLGEIFSTSPLKPLKNSTKLEKKQVHNVLYQVCVLGSIRKTRWPPRSLICRDIFDFSSETAEWNSTKQEARSQRPLQSLCLSGRSEKKIVALSDSSKRPQTRLHVMWPFGPLVTPVILSILA